MDSIVEEEACKGCLKIFPSNIILRHVSQAKKCKSAYGDDYESFKAEKARAKSTRYKQKNKEKVNGTIAKYR